MADSEEFPEEGMMFIGDKGKIVGGFHSEEPRLIPEAKMRAYRTANHLPDPPPRRARGGRQGTSGSRNAAWIAAFKGGPTSFGDFTLAGPICDAMNLASISLRLGGRRLLFDSAKAKITNISQANRYLTREYRPGWEL